MLKRAVQWIPAHLRLTQRVVWLRASAGRASKPLSHGSCHWQVSTQSFWSWCCWYFVLFCHFSYLSKSQIHPALSLENQTCPYDLREIWGRCTTNSRSSPLLYRHGICMDPWIPKKSLRVARIEESFQRLMKRADREEDSEAYNEWHFLWTEYGELQKGLCTWYECLIICHAR